MSSSYIQSKVAELATHSSHYNPMKGRLQEKKKILILAVRLRPPGLDFVQNPKNPLLDLVLDLG